MLLDIPYKIGQKLWVIGVIDEVAEKCECCNHTKSWKNVYSITEDTTERIDIYISDDIGMSVAFENDDTMFRKKSIYLNLNTESNKWDFVDCYITTSKEDAESKLEELNKGTQGKETRLDLMKNLVGK